MAFLTIATPFLLQIAVNEVSMMRREASRVSFLMCPFCVRAPSSALTTHFAGNVRWATSGRARPYPA
jgi:hypothetical protein